MVVLLGGISKNSTDSSTSNSLKSSTNIQGAAGNLEYVKMLNRDNLTVRIVCPNNEIVKSGMGSDFSFSLGNEWQELAPISQVPLVGDIAQGALGILMASTGAAQASIEALWMSSASWRGCQLPRFSVSLSFLNYSRSASFMRNLKLLAQGALSPSKSYINLDSGDNSQAGDLEGLATTVGDLATKTNNYMAERIQNLGSDSDNQTIMALHNVGQDLATTLKNSKQFGSAAPWYYGLQNNADNVFTPKPNTTYTLQVGNYFIAPHLLVESVTPVLSKEVVASGNPVLMTINVVFRPYQKIDYNTFASYFKIG